MAGTFMIWLKLLDSFAKGYTQGKYQRQQMDESQSRIENTKIDNETARAAQRLKELIQPFEMKKAEKEADVAGLSSAMRDAMAITDPDKRANLESLYKLQQQYRGKAGGGGGGKKSGGSGRVDPSFLMEGL